MHFVFQNNYDHNRVNEVFSSFISIYAYKRRFLCSSVSVPHRWSMELIVFAWMTGSRFIHECKQHHDCDSSFLSSVGERLFMNALKRPVPLFLPANWLTLHTKSKLQGLCAANHLTEITLLINQRCSLHAACFETTGNVNRMFYISWDLCLRFCSV